MQKSGRRLVVAAVLVLIVPGCASSRLVPAERITVENVGRLETVYGARLANYVWFYACYFPWGLVVPDRPHLIVNAAVDAQRQLLYVQLENGNPLRLAGFHTYDLRTGFHRHYTPAPSNPDLTGLSQRADGPSFIDAQRGVAWYEASFRGARSLLELDLADGGARLVARDVCLAGVVDDHRLLARRPCYLNTTRVLYIDRDRGEVISEHAVPALEDDIDIAGAAGDFVLACTHARDNSRRPLARCVLAPDGDHLRLVGTLPFQPGELPGMSAIDPERLLWITAGGWSPEDWTVRVYSIPELALVVEWPAPCQIKGLQLVPGSTVCVIRSGRDGEELHMVGVDDGRDLGQVHLKNLGYGWLLPLVDGSGVYLGGFSDEGVQLFAVAPGSDRAADAR